MKHTECEECKLREGDCGHHFKMDGVTNYDIASLSACDRYGNCDFFKAKVKPQGNLISREALLKAIETCDKFACLTDTRLVPFRRISGNEEDYEPYVHLRDIKDAIDNALAVEINTNDIEYEAYCKGLEDGKKIARPQGAWELSSIQVVGENWYKCSICGRKIRTSTYHLKEYPFCHCGADMRKGGAGYAL